MKKITLALLVVLFFGAFDAQTLSVVDKADNDISKTQIEVSGASTEFELYYGFKVKNNGSGSEVVRARRIELSVDCNTGHALCWDVCPPAVNSCTDLVLDNALTRTIGAGASDETGIGHLYLNGSAGTSLLRYVFFLDSDNDDSTYVDVLYKHNLISVEESNQEEFMISPNPSNDFIKLSFQDNEKHNVKIVDVLGKVIFNQDMFSSETIDLSKNNKGVYFVVVSDMEKRNITSKKLVLE